VNLIHLVKKYNILVGLSIIILFFDLSINTLTYIFDGGHHGSIFLNALNIIEGKVPYKEIFLQYGYLNALINAFFLIIFDYDIVAIYFSTSFFYFGSIIILSLISKDLGNKNFFLLTIIICVFNHPVPEFPWPNYTAFFFLTLSIYIFKIKKKKNLFFSGFFLAITCLVRENFYYFILPSFVFINFCIYFFYKQFNKNFFLLFGFCLPILFLFLYLYINNIFLIWLDYQKIPFVYLDKYELNFFDFLKNFITFFLYEAPFLIATNPQYFIINLILFFNFYTLIEQLFFKSVKNINIIIISTLCLSSIVVSINLELFRLYTSVLIGLPVIFYKLNQLSSNNTKFIYFFIIIFISTFSFFYFPKGNVKSFDNIDYKKSYSLNKINFFKSQKWQEDKWNFVFKIKKIDEIIYNNCDISYVLNLTPNAFILALSNLPKIQLVPLFNEHLDRKFPIIFQKNLINQIQDEITKQNIYIYSMENNVQLLNIDLPNYKLFDKLDISDYKGTQVRIFVPTKCLNKIYEKK